jgi:ABC-type Fe3+ transport system substrate-binding protein
MTIDYTFCRREGRMTRRHFMKGAAIAGCTWLTANSADAQTTDVMNELYAQARQEGILNYYAGGPVAAQKATIAEFSAAFPAIKVNLVTGFSNQLASSIDDQIVRHQMEADVANLQTIQDIERWKRQDTLLAGQIPNFEKVLPEFKDADGTSVGVRAYALGYGYNTRQLSADRAPKSALDFLDPNLKDRIITSYPQDDDVTLYLYDSIVSRHGWEFMPKFMKNRPQFIRGHLGVVQQLAKGVAAVSFDTSVGTALGAKRDGAPLEIIVPTVDPMPVWENRCCIFKACPHPNAARLFVAWMLSYEHQSKQGLWSTREDIAPAVDGFKALSAYNTVHDFRRFILDEQRASDLRRRFESYVGPVRGEPVLGQ